MCMNALKIRVLLFLSVNFHMYGHTAFNVSFFLKMECIREKHNVVNYLVFCVGAVVDFCLCV